MTGERPNIPNKSLARKATNHALRVGTLTKGPCEVCGEQKVDVHHMNYNDPLDVKYLCKRHHRAWHKENGILPGYNERMAVFISEEAYKVLADMAEREHRTIGKQVERLIYQEEIKN